MVLMLAFVKGILSRAVDIIAEPHTADTDHSISRSAHAAGSLVRISPAQRSSSHRVISLFQVHEIAGVTS